VDRQRAVEARQPIVDVPQPVIEPRQPVVEHSDRALVEAETPKTMVAITPSAPSTIPTFGKNPRYSRIATITVNAAEITVSVH
jgi:hypothetical protein